MVRGIIMTLRNTKRPGFTLFTILMAFAEEHDKPLMIAEAAPKVDLKVGDGAAHWAGWFAPLFDQLDYEMWQDSLVSSIRPGMKKAGELRVFGDRLLRTKVIL